MIVIRTLIVIFILFVLTLPARADLLGFLGGDTIDDTAERIDSMLAQYSNKLLGKSDEYVLRLENLVTDTMTEGFERTETLRARVFEDLQKLESDLMDDLQALVFEGECAALRVAKDAPKEALTAVSYTHLTLPTTPYV